MTIDRPGPRWARATLWIAAAYNLGFGAFAVLWPTAWFELASVPVPEQLYLWQCIGMIVGVYGIGYACAARDPLRHWPIVLTGLLGKLLGPIGFVDAALSGQLPWSSGWLILCNDVVWWGPFAAILLAARHHHRVDQSGVGDRASRAGRAVSRPERTP